MKSRLEALVTEMVERGILFEDAVQEFEKHFILSVLKRTNGNLSKAAEELRIHRNALSKRIEKYYQNKMMSEVATPPTVKYSCLDLDWKGALQEMGEEYSSVDLQHKALDWWNE